jgi:hypothetical protein
MLVNEPYYSDAKYRANVARFLLPDRQSGGNFLMIPGQKSSRVDLAANFPIVAIVVD